MNSIEPKFMRTFQSGELHKKVQKAWDRLASCDICPRNCGVDRLSGQTGICDTGRNPVLYRYKAHLGEETPLIGKNGSGTFFFTHCNLRCIFCQNFEMSHLGEGREISLNQMSDMMLVLQKSGCSNINFITPTHVVPQILAALEIAIQKGLCIPLVYNTSGYESVDTLKLLDGVIDVYMPDFKFWDPDVSEKLCGLRDYPEIARQAVLEMHRQVGDLKINGQGLAIQGLLLRHLLLPSGLGGTYDIMKFISEAISPDTYVNIMPQFKPFYRSKEVRELLNPITEDDYAEALQTARELGIHRIDPLPGKVFMGF